MNANYTIAQFEHMCRVCMYVRMPVDDENTIRTDAQQVEQQTQELKSILTPIGDNEKLQIYEILVMTTPELLIEVNDALPQFVCVCCLEKLQQLHQFQTMCIRSEQCMRDMLTSHKSIENNSTVVEEVECVVVTNNDNADYIDEQKPECEQPLNSIDSSEATERRPKQIRNSKRKPTTKTVNDSSNSDQVIPESKMHVCDQCSRKFVSAKCLLQHKALHPKGASPFKCKNCGKKFKLRETLKRHKATHDKTADSCKRRETTPSNNQTRFQAINVNFSGEQQAQFAQRSGRYACDQCPRIYVGLKCLLRHKQMHPEGSSSYECKNCGKQFNLRQSLTRHKATHDATADGCKRREIPRPHICKYCNKGFQLLHTLREHIRTHTGEQPYLCQECGKSFSSASNMTEHRRRHTGEKRYECPDCPKKFICYSNLSAHRAVHTKIKAHVCDICGAAFCKQTELRKHKIYHTDDKRYKCDFCEMRFFRADHMRRHQLTHTGEKPYKCKYCERAFAQSNEMIKHLRTHLGEKVYKCEMCPQRFRMAGELRKHFAEHKNDDAETRARNLQALQEAEARLSAALVKK